MRRVGLIDITVGNATRLGASQRSATRRSASHHIATQRLSRWGSPAARARLATDSAPYSSRTVAYLSSTCEISYPLTSLAGLRPAPGYHPPDYRSLILICPRVCIYFQSRSPGGTSRSFLGASARSIARSASATASDLVAAWPLITTSATDADHFHTCRPIP